MPRKPGPARLERDRKRPKDGNWYIYWTEGGRSREHSTGTRDRDEAELYFEEWKLRRRRPGRAVHPEEFFVTDAVSHYLTHQLDEVMDPERLANAAKPIIKFFDGYSVGEVHDALVKDYCAQRRRRKNIQDGTLRKELGFLSAAIRFAKDEKLITDTVKIRLPSKPEGRIRFLTCDEAIRLIRNSRTKGRNQGCETVPETLTEHLTLFLRIGLLTGQRKEAILSLRWDDINFESDSIDWNPVGRKRTSKQRPQSRIPKRLKKHLLRRRRRFPHDDHVVTFRGRPVKNIRRAFHTAVEAAGLETTGARKVVPHTMRHTCATWLMQKAAPKWDTCGFLGMKMETLERNYGHHHPDHQKGPGDAI